MKSAIKSAAIAALFLLVLTIASPAHAQNAYYNDTVRNFSGQAVPNTPITVCAFGASGIPCSPAVQRTNTDALGNYVIVIAPGTYVICAGTSNLPFNARCWNQSIGAGGGEPSAPNQSFQFDNGGAFGGSQFFYDAANSSGNCAIDDGAGNVDGSMFPNFIEPQQYTTHAQNSRLGITGANTLCLAASSVNQISTYMGSGTFAQMNSSYFIVGTYQATGLMQSQSSPYGPGYAYCSLPTSMLPGTAGNQAGDTTTCYDTSNVTTYPYCLYGTSILCLDSNGDQSLAINGDPGGLILGDPSYHDGAGIITLFSPTTGNANISALDPGKLSFNNGAMTVDQSGNIVVNSCTGCGTPGSGVSSLNSLTGALSITAGTNVTVTPSGSSIQIAAATTPPGGSSGNIQVNNAGAFGALSSPSNCSAGQATTGINGNGAAQNCFTPGTPPGGSSGNIQTNSGSGGFQALSPTNCSALQATIGINVNGISQGCFTPYSPTAFQTLTDAATVAYNFASSGVPNPRATITLGGNRTLSVTNQANGGSGLLDIVQPASGGPYTLTLGTGGTGGCTAWSIAATGTAISLSAAANAVDQLLWTNHGGVCEGALIQNLGGTSNVLTQDIANGTAALGTSSISSGTCASAVTVTATGVLTTDSIGYTPNGDPTGVTGYAPSSSGSLYIWAYPTAGDVNFKVCNNTGGSITPSALTLNWRVTR